MLKTSQNHVIHGSNLFLGNFQKSEFLTLFWPKNGQNSHFWAKMTIFDQKWSFLTQK